jgi:hypothetical protein
MVTKFRYFQKCLTIDSGTLREERRGQLGGQGYILIKGFSGVQLQINLMIESAYVLEEVWFHSGVCHSRSVELTRWESWGRVEVAKDGQVPKRTTYVEEQGFWF